jgi:hypothetical protein
MKKKDKAVRFKLWGEQLAGRRNFFLNCYERELI